MSIVPFGRRSGGFSDHFALDLWDPFDGFPFSNPLASSSGFFNPFVLDLWDPFDSYTLGTSFAQLSSGIEWKETPEAHFFKAKVPGVREEEVQVVVDGQTLQISGGQFLSRFSLPENAKLDHLRAGMEHGVLMVMVPKVEVKKPTVRTVEISG